VHEREREKRLDLIFSPTVVAAAAARARTNRAKWIQQPNSPPPISYITHTRSARERNKPTEKRREKEKK
jgi:hypothetical protein